MRALRIALPLALLASPALSLDLQLPGRKAGLWEIRSPAEGLRTEQAPFQQCVDAATDRLLMAGSGLPGESCVTRKMRRTGNGFIIDSVCDVVIGRSVSHTRVTGDFSSAYTVEISSQLRGRILRAIPELRRTAKWAREAKWLGECEPGQRPGDIIVDGEVKMNVVAIEAAVAQARRKK